MNCPVHGELNADWTSCPFCIRDRQRTAAPQAPAFAPPGYGGGGGGAPQYPGGGAGATRGGGGGGYAGGDAGITRGAGGGFAGGDAGVTRGAGGGGNWGNNLADSTRGANNGFDPRGFGGSPAAGHTRIIDPPPSAQRRIRAWLIQKDGPRPDQITQVKDDVTWIGRDRRNDVFIDDDTVSSQHAKLWVDDQRVLRLLNVSTTNGTRVNGVRVEAPIALAENDEITIGIAVLVLKRLDAPIPNQAAAPSSEETIVMPPGGLGGAL